VNESNGTLDLQWTDRLGPAFDGRMLRCEVENACPKIFEANAASLLHTDSMGKDLADPSNVRYYQILSL